MLDAGHLPIQNDTCRIRPLEHQDARAYADGTEDALVRANAHLPETRYTAESVSELIDGALRTGLDSGELAVLAIAHPETNDFRGSVVLFDVVNDSAEVGFWLAPAARGEGLASASLRLSQQFARHCGLFSLKARTTAENTASQHVLSNTGFTEVSRGTELTPAGREADLIHYEWPSNQDGQDAITQPPGPGHGHHRPA